MLVAGCSPKGTKPTGGDAGGGQGNAGADGGPITTGPIQTSGSSDTPSVRPPNAPPSAGGSQGGGTAAGQQGGGNRPPVVEPIQSSNPNVSTPQGCTMQRRSVLAGGSGNGLMLDGWITNAVPRVPPSVAIEFKRKSGTKETTTRCVGVLSVREYKGLKLDFTDLGYEGSRPAADVIFPRISLATHCLRTTEEGRITGLIFRSLVDPARSTVFEVGQPSQAFSTQGISSNKLFDLNDIKFKTTKDACTQKAIQSGDKQLPCFTLGDDEFDLITERERRLVDELYFKRKEKAFGGREYRSTAGNWLLAFPVPTATEVDWVKEFSEGSSRNMTTLSVDDQFQLSSGFASVEDVLKYLNKNLLSVRATRLVRGQAETMLPFEVPKPEAGWQNTLDIFGEMKPVESGVEGAKNTFVINAISVKGIQHNLKKGDSGTRLVGEFLETKPPFVTVRSYREVMGVLSTVGGDDVCAGDDLLCCDRS